LASDVSGGELLRQ